MLRVVLHDLKIQMCSYLHYLQQGFLYGLSRGSGPGNAEAQHSSSSTGGYVPHSPAVEGIQHHSICAIIVATPSTTARACISVTDTFECTT